LKENGKNLTDEKKKKAKAGSSGSKKSKRLKKRKKNGCDAFVRGAEKELNEKKKTVTEAGRGQRVRKKKNEVGKDVILL